MELINSEQQLQLQEALEHEERFRFNLTVFVQSTRKHCADIILYLTRKHDLTNEVFFTAINLFDACLHRFELDKKGRTISCMSLATLTIAIEMIYPLKNIFVSDLILESGFYITKNDLIKTRSSIINKFHLENRPNPVTALNYLKLFHELFRLAAIKLEIRFQFTVLSNLIELIRCLEILKCDLDCAKQRPSVLAFVILVKQYDFRFQEADISPKLAKFKEFTEVLQGLENLNFTTLLPKCADNVREAIAYYNRRQPQRRHPMWMVFTPTPLHPPYKPSDRLKSNLKNFGEYNLDVSLSPIKEMSPNQSSDES